MGITRAQLKLLRRRDNRRKWYRQLFLPVFVLGPVLVVAFLTAVDPHASFARDTMWFNAGNICSEYNAQLRALSPDNRVMSIAIPDELTNETDMGCYQAAQLFHRLCSLGGPRMELWVTRIHREVRRNGAWSADKDSGEQFIEVDLGIPSTRNPMTLEWTEILIKGDMFE